jgi:hypothetical protein
MVGAALAVAGSAQAAVVAAKPVKSWQTNGRVTAIAGGDDKLAAGGDFTRLGGVTQQMFGMFSE